MAMGLNAGMNPGYGGLNYGFAQYDEELPRIAAQGDLALKQTKAKGDQDLRYLQQQQTGDQAQRGFDTFRTQTEAQTAQRGQDFNLQAALRGYDTTDRGNQLQFDTANRGNELQAETARRGQDLSFQSSMAPVTLARDRFNSVLPMFQQALAAGPGEKVGGQNTPQPGVTVGGVYTPQQIEEQVNAAYAKNAGQTDTARRLATESAAGRGIAPQSPLLSALNGQLLAAQMAADADAGRNIRFDAAGANAKQQTASEGLRGELWQADNAMEIQRRQMADNSRNALLAALAGFSG